MVISYTYEQWVEIYKPIANHLVPNAPFSGTMFETYGAEREFVREQDPRYIWTLYDNGSIGAGWHFVNRSGYFIASVRRNLREEQYADICDEPEESPDDEIECESCASEIKRKDAYFCDDCGEQICKNCESTHECPEEDE